MAGDFGVVGSQIQKDLGIEWAPKADILNEFVKESGGRCDTWMISYWYDHSGEDFDWFVEGADFEVLAPAPPPIADRQRKLHPSEVLPEAGERTTTTRSYTRTSTAPSPRTPTCSGPARPRSRTLGPPAARLIYGRTGEQLIAGRVRRGHGRLRPDAEAGYLKVNAKATVVLACGDYGAKSRR